jgi:hypothetical protein
MSYEVTLRLSDGDNNEWNRVERANPWRGVDTGSNLYVSTFLP